MIFDADGVMIKSETMFSKIYEKEYGIADGTMLPFFEGVFSDCLVGKADLKKELLPYLKKWKWKKSVEDFINFWHTSEHFINHELVEYVQNLRKRGIKCYLATNQEKYRTEYMINEMGFAGVFDDIFSSAYIGYKKPNHNFFQYVMEKINVRKNEVVFWDDTQGHVDSAKIFGISAEFYMDIDDFKKKMEKYLSE